MTFTFRPAKRQGVSLLIGLAGASGSGKTYSALELATGMAGGKRFCVIDTEAGRAQHYADLFDFDHGDMHPPFRPDAYAAAIQAADKEGYPVIVVDSMSHEWAGDGGILDMQTAEFERMGSREAVKMASWIKPKGEHKRMVSKLLQIRAHLILCFRAEEKIEMVKEHGKLVVRPKQSSTGLDGWVPICEKTLPYELTTSFLLVPSEPGVPHPIKLQEQHRPYFPAGKPISRHAGERLAAWASGGERPKMTQEHPPKVEDTEALRWRGELEGVTCKTIRKKPVWTVTVAGREAKTADESMAAEAELLAHRQVEIVVSKTSRGGLKIEELYEH